MKSKKIISVLLSLFFLNNIVSAQNTISIQSPVIESANGEKIMSYVILINKSNLNAYGISTYMDVDGAQFLSVNELDNSGSYIKPVNSNSTGFDIYGNSGGIILKDGFFDEENNIIVYGYEIHQRRGVIIKIIMNNGYPDNIRYVVCPTADTPIVDGCWSQYAIGNNIFKTYDFIVEKDNGILYRTDYNFASRPSKKFNAPGKMTTVKWDNNRKKHIVGGTYQNASIIGHFDNSINMGGGTFYVMEPLSGTIEPENKFVFAGNEHYYDDMVYICQGMTNSGIKGFFISEFNYITGTVNQSTLYNFNNTEHTISNIAHNFMNLFVLGYNHGMDIGFITQIDLYDHLNYNIKNMPAYGINEGLLFPYKSSIRFDDVTFNVITTMTSELDNAYITETFDLNFDNCMNEDFLTTSGISFNIISESASNIASGASFNTGSVYNKDEALEYEMYSEIRCTSNENRATRNNERITEIKKIIYERINKYNNENDIYDESFVYTPEIHMFGNDGFVCVGFEGKCNYKIYDMSGRLIHEETTYNHEFNKININSNGIYILQVKDENNRGVNRKFVK